MTRGTVQARESRSDLLTSFSGHETFVLRYGWLKKAVDAVAHNGRAFSDPDAVVRLGVGKNMVRSMRHWALAASVVAERPGSRGAELEPTPLGRMIFGEEGLDPFFEDEATLWLLHWLLVSNEARCTTWSWVFNWQANPEFTSDRIMALVAERLRQRGASPPSEKTLRRDVDCFIRTYVPGQNPREVLEDSLDCPLTELGLLEVLDGARSFRLVRGEQTLPDGIFAYAVADYWERRAPDRESLAFVDIAFGRNSPGVVFRLDEDSLAMRLDGLEHRTAGKISYGETAGLKQLYRHGRFSALEVLNAAYALPAGIARQRR